MRFSPLLWLIRYLLADNSNTSLPLENGVLLYQNGESAFFIENESRQNITFAFPAPTIENELITTCSRTNTNITEMTREYSNLLLKDWLNVKIDHPFYQQDYTVHGNKIILHQNAKIARILLIRIQQPDYKNLEWSGAAQDTFHFTRCELNRNKHVILVQAETNFNKILLRVPSKSQLDGIIWKLKSNSYSPDVTTSESSKIIQFKTDLSRVSKIEIYFTGKTQETEHGVFSAVSCLSLEIEEILVVFEEDRSKFAKFVEPADPIYMEGDDKNPVIPRILGSSSNYGSTLFLEETPEQALLATKTIWKEVYGSRNFLEKTQNASALRLISI